MNTATAWVRTTGVMEQEPDRQVAKSLRKKMKLSQDDFADLIGASRGRYSTWESGGTEALKRDSWGPLQVLIDSGGETASMPSDEVDDLQFTIEMLERLTSALRSRKMTADSKVYFYKQIITILHKNMEAFCATLKQS